MRRWLNFLFLIACSIKGLLTNKKRCNVDGHYRHMTDIRLSDVVGSLEPRYAGKTWLALFPSTDDPYGLKRGQRYARDLKNNPHYYLSEKEKRNLSLRNIDGELYIDDGHHRIVIGRVFLEANGLEPIIKNVFVGYYTGGLKHRIRISPRCFKHRLMSRFYGLNRLIRRWLTS